VHFVSLNRSKPFPSDLLSYSLNSPTYLLTPLPTFLLFYFNYYIYQQLPGYLIPNAKLTASTIWCPHTTSSLNDTTCGAP